MEMLPNFVGKCWRVPVARLAPPRTAIDPEIDSAEIREPISAKPTGKSLADRRTRPCP